MDQGVSKSCREGDVGGEDYILYFIFIQIVPNEFFLPFSNYVKKIFEERLGRIEDVSGKDEVFVRKSR